MLHKAAFSVLLYLAYRHKIDRELVLYAQSTTKVTSGRHIKINTIVKYVLKGTDATLFVDDFALCIRGKSVQRVKESYAVMYQQCSKLALRK